MFASKEGDGGRGRLFVLVELRFRTYGPRKGVKPRPGVGARVGVGVGEADRGAMWVEEEQYDLWSGSRPIPPNEGL